MGKFTEAVLEDAIIKLLGQQGYPHVQGQALEHNSDGTSRAPTEVLIVDDLKAFLRRRYQAENITENEIEFVVRQLQMLPASDLYDSNKTFCKWLSDGFLLRRDDRSPSGAAAKKDIYIQLLNYSDLADMRMNDDVDGSDTKTDTTADVKTGGEASPRTSSRDNHDGTDNIYKIVNQLEIEGLSSTDPELRIPDGILYINGLPLVVFEFKSAIRENATLNEAYVQLTRRYRRAIPQLFVFNALCVICDGVNNKMGHPVRTV